MSLARPVTPAASRAPLNRASSPKSIMPLKEGIRQLAAASTEPMKPKATAAFIADVAEPLPVQVFLKMFGLPVARQQEYRAVVKEHMAGHNDMDPRAVMMRLLKV